VSEKKVAEIWKIKEKKKKKKESGCLIFEHEIEAVRGIFWQENRGPNPLI